MTSWDRQTGEYHIGSGFSVSLFRLQPKLRSNCFLLWSLTLTQRLKWKIWGEGTPFSACPASHESRAHRMQVRVNIRCHICLSFFSICTCVLLMIMILHRCCHLVVYNRSYSVPPTIPVHFTNLEVQERCLSIIWGRNAVPLHPKAL